MSALLSLSSLLGRRVLLTGAAGVLGGAIAEMLAGQGATLQLVDRPGADFSRTLDRLGEAVEKTQVIECDLEVEADRKRLITLVIGFDSPLDVLINNAAFVGDSNLSGWVEPFEKQSVATWRRAIEVNLTAAFELCQGLAPSLRRSGRGVIVNVASLYGHLGPDWKLYDGTTMGNPAAYAASKGGLIQLTRWLATTLAPEIRVNAVSPGGFLRNQPLEFVERYVARTPLRRMADESDIMGTIAYLASDLSSYVTGQNLALDGGWSAW
ncbi:MAG: SDR family oxidoreductase [Leptospirales bacterium]|nr:SDR family oxidoreductase [Leptospirales bacterium]